MLHRSVVRPLIVMFALALAASSCAKHDQPVQRSDSSVTTDSSFMTNRNNAYSGDSMGGSTSNHGAQADQSSRTDQSASSTGPVIQQLPDSDPEAKPPMQFPPQYGPNKSQAPIGSARILSSTELSKMHPNIPGYNRDPTRLFSRDVPGVVSKSTAIYRNVNDSNQTIRLTIVDQDERFADRMIKEILSLEANDGKRISISPSGETLTAYEVHVNGSVGASSYIPSEHVATLSLVVGDHRLVQFREQPATSRDHLLEVAKNFDLKRFENAH